jgi:CrcB protein
MRLDWHQYACRGSIHGASLENSVGAKSVETWVRLGTVALGGAVGSCVRYGLGVWISQKVGVRFPWATFTINISGSFAIGFLTAMLTRWLPHPHVRLLVLVGFLGGYTTFSTFAYESFTLWERGESGNSLLYMGGSVVAGFIAVVLGIGVAHGLTNVTERRAARATNVSSGSAKADQHEASEQGDAPGATP